MRAVLLDTHVFLWLQTAPDRLGPTLSLLEDENLILLLSAASSWEIAVKWALGKLPLPAPPADYVPDRMADGGISALPVHHAHSLAVATLPDHHRDPFDRLLLAQATIEGIPLVTADPAMQAYDAELMWVGEPRR